MSKIIPISITTTEQAVTLDATYQFVWLRNMGENDCLLSDHSGIVAGDDDVMTVKAGESGRISTSGRAVYIKTVDGTSTGEIHAQNFSDVPFKSRAKGGGQSITVEPLTVTDNGVYTAPTGKAYSPVSVDVQEQPWQPLEDGYSNFWFELTDDTLSPWLNFSAKTENAVIDWGDGSGEVALDTLTPTHTYSKAGKYVVKVKGVRAMSRQQTNMANSEYFYVLKNVELNSEVDTINNHSFYFCTGLENVVVNADSITVGTYIFNACCSLRNINIFDKVTELKNFNFSVCQNLFNNNGRIDLPNIVSLGQVFNSCSSIKTVYVGKDIETIGNSVFSSCFAFSEFHIAATTPPTIGTNVFASVQDDFIIYVPVGYGDTYKAASGWSTYADHILEEGQTPNRAMLAKFNSTKESEVKDDELYKDENR